MNVSLKQLFLILIGGLILIPLSAQDKVFPYEFAEKWGLVNEKNEKITDPVFTLIEVFRNQEVNEYGIYYKNGNSVDPATKKSTTQRLKGIINKKGEIVEGIEHPELEYDGNGRIAISTEKNMVLIYNLDEARKIAEIPRARVEKIISGKTFYIIIFHYETKSNSIIDDEGNTFPVTTNPYQKISYIKMMGDCPVFGFEKPANERKHRLDFDFYNCRGELVGSNEMNSEGSFFEDQPVFVEEPPPPFMDQTKQQIQLSGLVDKFPDYKLGKPFTDRHNQVQLVEIEKDYMKGLVSTNGELVAEPQFYQIKTLFTDFNGDHRDEKQYVLVQGAKGEGVISLSGREIIPARFGQIRAIPDTNLFFLVGGGYGGYASNTGKIYLPKECGCLE